MPFLDSWGHGRGSPRCSESAPDRHRRSELDHYTRCQASLVHALTQWQADWAAVSQSSMQALSRYGLAISYRRLFCGGIGATLWHQAGGSIDSGPCASLAEACQLVLGRPEEEQP